MASVLAIVSKAVFEKIVKGKGGGELGDRLGIDRYTSTHASLDVLADGGSLFLVTVRPPDEKLWLVGVLDDPEPGDAGWQSAPSSVPITDISALASKLKFATGTGITARPGALGMSLQTPRVLSDDDVALLRGAAGGTRKKPTASKATPKQSAKSTSRATAPKTTGKTTTRNPAKLSGKRGKKTTTVDHDGEAALDAIAAAIDRSDGEAALDAALAAWRMTRAPALAELVDAISARVSAAPVATEQELAQLATGKRALDVGRMLPAIPALPVSFLPTAGHLLSALEDDPRIASAIATWTLDPPTTSSSTYPFWTRTLDIVGRTGDVRAIAVLQQRLKMKPGGSTFWPRFYAALEKTVGKLEAISVPPVDDQRIARLARSVGKLGVVEASAPPRRAAAPVSGSPLVQAATDLGANRVTDAIDAMLVAWRETKSPAIAELIDRATRLLPSYDRPLPVDAKAAQAAWMDAFAADAAAAMPQLLAHVNHGGPAQAERRLVELATLPPDPRVAFRLAELAQCGGISPERTQYWKSLWQIIANVADPRVAGPLRVAFDDFHSTYYDHHRQGRRIVGEFCASPPPPEQVLAAELTKIEGAIGRLEQQRDGRELQLLDAIAQDWKDDGPRLVYADWLMEREHPRAEVIVLSCKEQRAGLSPAESKQLRKLRGGFHDTTHLFGPISDVGYELDRGIPAKLALDFRTSTLTLRQLAGHPLLAAVEAIGVAREGYPAADVAPEDLARVMADPIAKRLAKVSGVNAEQQRALPALVGKRWKLAGRSFVRA